MTKGGLINWALMGDPNASVPAAEPVCYRPMPPAGTRTRPKMTSPGCHSSRAPIPRAGRLVTKDEVAYDADEAYLVGHDDRLARDEGIDGGGASAEEAAIHYLADESRSRRAGNQTRDSPNGPWCFVFPARYGLSVG